MDALIDLVAHKRSLLKVLEVNLDDEADADGPSLWLGAGEIAARQARAQYDFACTNAETLVAARKSMGPRDRTRPSSGQPREAGARP